MYIMHTGHLSSMFSHLPATSVYLPPLSYKSLTFILFWSTDFNRVIYVMMDLDLVSTFAYNMLHYHRSGNHHKQHVHDIITVLTTYIFIRSLEPKLS